MGLRSRIGILGYFILAGVAVVICTAAADALFLTELKSSYDAAGQMISGIAGSGESGDSLLRWLKERPNEDFLLEGERKMASYGYGPQSETVWDRAYRSARTRILFFSAGFDLFLLFLLFFFLRFLQTHYHKKSIELESVLRQLQNTDAQEPDFSSFDLEDSLKDRVVSLREMIQTDRGNLVREKEETKSLVTDLSHQLKTPVAALKISLELIASDDLPKERRGEFLERCMSQLAGMEDLTKSLIQVSRMEKGMIRLCPKTAPVRETIRAAVSRMYEKAFQKRIEIEMKEDGLPEDICVLHDAKWTTEVFVILIDNAVKYSGPDTKITIWMERLATYLKVSVEDEGSGIPKEERHKVFQRFYRGAAAGEIEGSGVGLYLARQIMERQDGTVYAGAKKNGGSGSVFSVQIPLRGLLTETNDG